MSKALVFPFSGKQVGVTRESESFQGIDLSKECLIPLAPHPGAFGVQRKFHVHEGVDLYCSKREPVFAIEKGTVIAILRFTGPHAGSPWWNNTYAVMVEGAHGVLNYGEIEPAGRLYVGAPIEAGDQIGAVLTVLAKDKGRPRDMLHLELYEFGTREVATWKVGEEKPELLRDPTGVLVEAGMPGGYAFHDGITKPR